MIITFKKKFLSFVMLPMVLLPVTQSHAAGVNLITISKSGEAVGGLYTLPMISSTGRYIGFESSSSQLVANDANGGVWDVFVRDSVLKKTILVSVNSSGTASGDGQSDQPVMTSNGRFVLFRSVAKNLVAGGSSGTGDLYVRDLSTKVTKRVTVSSTGHSSNSSAWRSGYDISQDGRFVVFSSEANNLVANDTNNRSDIFVRDTKAGTTKLVSINNTKTDSGNEASRDPQISPNGRYVRFYSKADDLVAHDNDNHTNLFVRDLVGGRTTLLEESSVISAEGRFVIFPTDKRLVANDNNKKTDVYVRDLVTNTVKLVSVNRTGKASGNDYSLIGLAAGSGSTISPNGRYVIFDSVARDLVPNDKAGIGVLQVYIRDLVANKTKKVSIDASGKLNKLLFYSTAKALSSNGKTIVFQSIEDNAFVGNLFAYDISTNKTTLISAYYDIDIKSLSLSADGRYVTFSSRSPLVAHDNNNATDVFVKDLKTGVTKLISMNRTGSASGQGASDTPVLSADGRVVLFESAADNLVSNDTDRWTDAFTYRIW